MPLPERKPMWLVKTQWTDVKVIKLDYERDVSMISDPPDYKTWGIHMAVVLTEQTGIKWNFTRDGYGYWYTKHRTAHPGDTVRFIPEFGLLDIVPRTDI